ncbi:hypothetical protein [Azospirillum picis]|uniref:Transposase n=1 Tax=Azospirillum picis TaxID=488438 RepID=A0ABU0MKV8_9PROT|nr:hypothetical protein [Azospirillum picis]MBP2300305.1 hypothetical protein [Azospirillum picis]MDQ0534101.1 hypothetical protein [Azospirillum picis]
MPTLWTALRCRWLDAGGRTGPDRLSDRLRRDIGLDGGLEEAEGPSGPSHRPSPEHIRLRNLSDARTFLTLQPYR